ncbi:MULTISPECIES: C39 family peptidase [unclassified Lysinibacillus]|uniref:C39 family peptidase n=1 Tax=unclassified Lysinibacillus TaxID=2636778 RepID=UPI003809D617
MATGTLGTSLADFENGLRKHLNLNLTSNMFEVARTGATSKFSNYKNLIDNGHPVGIRFTNIITAIFGSSAYSWHYVLGTGYSGNNVLMLDPDGSTSGTKSFNYSTYESDMNLIWIIP